MKITTDINEINAVLLEYKGEQAFLYMISINHSKLAIQICSPSKNQELYIICVGCKNIVANFKWRITLLSASIEIMPYNEKKIYLNDKESNFSLECDAGITLIESLPNEVRFSLENFIEFN